MRKLSIAAVAALSLSLAACGGDAPKKDAADKTAKADADKAKDGADAKDPAEEKKDGDKDAVALADPAAAFLAAVDAYNKGEFDKALEPFADDIALSFIGMPEGAKGKDTIKSGWEQGRTAFPDIQVKVSRLLVSDGLLAAHMVSNGTHKGEFQGTAPTDKPVGTELLYLVEHDGKQFKKITLFSNPMAEMTQIGAAPEGTPPIPVPALPAEPQVISGDANEANITLAKGWHDAFVNGAPAEKITEFLSDSFAHHAIAQGTTDEGVEKNIEGMKEMLAAISDPKVINSKYVSVGDYVLTTGQWSGKHTGDMGPIKATNKEFTVDFAEVMLITDGKIAETWSYENPMQMMGQLGLLPEEKPEAAIAKK